jgi:prepilin-type N-terminal cleavage/methylation domain-containing protein
MSVFHAARKGFTLMEVLGALMILSIAAGIMVTNFNHIAIQGSAKNTQNNLLAIYNAQKNYFLSPLPAGNDTNYCTSATGICNSRASINATLGLNITDSYFTYTCSNVGGFQCVATNTQDATFQLTLNNIPIALPGGVGAPNPSCTYPAHPTYCPS